MSALVEEVFTGTISAVDVRADGCRVYVDTDSGSQFLLKAEQAVVADLVKLVGGKVVIRTTMELTRAPIRGDQ